MSIIFFSFFIFLILMLWLDFEITKVFSLESFAIFWCGFYYFFVPVFLYISPHSSNERFSTYYSRPDEFIIPAVVVCYSGALFLGVVLGRVTAWSQHYHFAENKKEFYGLPHVLLMI